MITMAMQRARPTMISLRAVLVSKQQPLQREHRNAGPSTQFSSRAEAASGHRGDAVEVVEAHLGQHRYIGDQQA